MKQFSMPSYFNTEHAPRTTEKTQAYWARYNKSWPRKFLFRLRGEWFTHESKTGDGMHFDDIWAYAKPDGNFTFDETVLFFSGDNPNTPSARDHELHIDPTYGYGYIAVEEAPGILRDIVVQDERGFVRNGRDREQVDSAFAASGDPWSRDLILYDESGVKYADESRTYEDFQKRESSYLKFSAELVRERWRGHNLKLGGEYQRYTARSYQHYFPHVVYKDSVVNGQWYKNGGFLDVDNFGYDVFGDNGVCVSSPRRNIVV